MTARARWWERRWAGAIVVAIVVAVYAPTLLFTRVDFDDVWLWSDNSPLRQMSSETLHDVFFELDAEARHPIGADYSPVRDLDVALDMAVFGDNEHGPHATQLALFALSVFGLGGLLVRFGFAPTVAWLGALVWAIHPMRVESVAWLSDRKDVLAGLFVVACGHAWIRYRKGASPAWLVIAALAVIAAVWSKAPAMFAPAVFLALDLLLLAPSRRRWIAAIALGAVAALAAVPVVLVNLDARIVDTSDAPSHGRIASSLGAQGHYVETLVLARPVSTNYAIQTDGPSAVDLVVGALAVIASIALIRYCRKPQPMALLAWTWIWFVPIGQLVIPVHIAVADRYAYLWTLGPLVGLVLAIEQLPRARAYLSTLLVAGLAVVTLRAEAPWTASTELFAQALESNPGDPLAYRSFAMSLYAAGGAKQALAVIERGLADHPRHIRLLLTKAFLFDAIGHHADALAVTRIAVATGAASAKWTLAGMLANDGHLDEALPLARAAFEKHPELVDYARRYGQLALDHGDAEIAVGALRAIRRPEARDHFMLGRALLRLDRAREADLELALARRDAPGLGPAIDALQRR